jgi:hypothetical protein
MAWSVKESFEPTGNTLAGRSSTVLTDTESCEGDVIENDIGVRDIELRFMEASSTLQTTEHGNTVLTVPDIAILLFVLTLEGNAVFTPTRGAYKVSTTTTTPADAVFFVTGSMTVRAIEQVFPTDLRGSAKVVRSAFVVPLREREHEALYVGAIVTHVHIYCKYVVEAG